MGVHLIYPVECLLTKPRPKTRVIPPCAIYVDFMNFNMGDVLRRVSLAGAHINMQI